MRELKKKYENIKKSRRNEKGITLVALIITIIVLLILAGVSISFVFNGGVLDKSQQAADEYEKAAEEESNLLEDIENLIDEKYNSVDQNGLAVRNITIKTDDPNVQIVIPKGFAPVILESGRTDSLPGESGDVKEIVPIGEWKNITAEQINKGIVLVDHAITYDNGQATGTVPDFNEYIWIPVSDMTKFARVAWTTPAGGTAALADESTENKYWEDKTTQEYTNMVSSIETNKGFYISRYEMSQKDNNIPGSNKGQQTWAGLKMSDTLEVSRNMKPSLNSHLMYGIERDSVLQWLLDSEAIISSSEPGENKTIELSDVESDIRTWANTLNSIGDAKTYSNKKQPTGTSEFWKANNIYDFAGNIWERTQEIYSTLDNEDDSLNICAIRGGGFDVSGNGFTAASRNNHGFNNTHGSTRI